MTMGHCAAEVTDVTLAADSLDEHSLQVMLYSFAHLADNSERYTPTERELFHSVARLLARVRDIHAERDRALRKADRQATLRTSRDNDLSDAFAAVVAGLNN